MRHQDLTINHRLESWVYANAAARTGATGFVAGDVGRVAYQSDTGQYWRLTAITPTWALIAPPNAAAYANLQTAQANPAVTTAVSPGVMMGLGVGHTITPTATGKILVTIAGALFQAVAAKLATGNIRYGTGTPPANGAAGTSGAAIGAGASLSSDGINNVSPFAVSAVVLGAALGVPLWFDLQLWTQAGGTVWVGGATITAVELP